MRENWVWQFPAYNQFRTEDVGDQLGKIELELCEAKNAHIEFISNPNQDNKDALIIELMDVIHAVETALRSIDYRSSANLNIMKTKVIKKNKDRGYYDPTEFDAFFDYDEERFG